ncbi:DUF6142 family protein [Konateibacter massiliensis]|uniref:DUF6142 family protein n=1 Tax=Konateibacter massiliensis TaxID=2002841 RepID=UPI000C14A0A4|nr:DUF6142 family protein [Konateibacter massiliensis]
MKRRQKRKQKDIKFSDKRHAVSGITSTVLGVISLGLMIALFIISYLQKGNAGIYTGSIGLSALIIAIVGLVKGLKSFGEKERYYLFSKIGSITNAIILIFWIAIYVIGTWY